jgi:protein gp37
MADTSIEWTDRVWNPTTGCDRVSPGCDHCYAMTMAKRLKGMGSAKYQKDGDPKTSGPGFGVSMHQTSLTDPLKWRKPQRIFVNSMSDLFHEEVADVFIGLVWQVMADCPQHTFQILTKRHARMRAFLSRFEPLPNVWLGVSAENQQWADIRIPALLDTPAAVRFVSAEPLLGRINLHTDPIEAGAPFWGSRLDWVIVGGESGRNARPMHPDWARGLRDQCQDAGVAFLFKQRGEWTWNEIGEFRVPTEPLSERVAVMHGAGMTAMTKSNPFNPFERGHPFWSTRIERVGKHRAGRELDGRTWDQYPSAVGGGGVE